MSSEAPLYTLYTSGTTAQPKGVVRASGGYAVALRYSMEHVFGLQEGETMFCASDLGWVVGYVVRRVSLLPVLTSIQAILISYTPLCYGDVQR